MARAAGRRTRRARNLAGRRPDGTGRTRQRGTGDVLNSERMTIKAAEAIQLAAGEAQRRGNPTLEDIHLLTGLLEQDDTVVVPILEKVGVNLTRLREGLRTAAER